MTQTDVSAQIEAWDRVRRLDGSALERVFETSTSPTAPIDGDTEGTVVAFTVAPLADRLLAALFAGSLPWEGKRFSPVAGDGVVLFQPRARLTLKLIMPWYRPTTPDGKVAAMQFTMALEKSRADAGRPVLALDYSLPTNPRLLKGLREEVVEVVPGVFLGKMMLSPDRVPWRWLARPRRWLEVGYFVLRTR